MFIMSLLFKFQCIIKFIFFTIIRSCSEFARNKEITEEAKINNVAFSNDQHV